MRIALLGTRGVPARYGGFETAVEEVGRRLAASHEVIVYGRGAGEPREHLGMTRVTMPSLARQSTETLSRTAFSVVHAALRARPDAAIVFNSANSPLLPLLRAARIPAALHTDGLEWRRGKWGRAGKAYYRIAEALGAALADALICDADAIAGYYRRRYGAPTTVIPYGAPIVCPPTDRLDELGLTPGGYQLVVARLEPENQVDVILRGLIAGERSEQIVVVGSAAYPSAHLADLEWLAASDERVRLLGSIWDQGLLDTLYAHARVYWHGHSVGGTNPSLLRAMGAGAPVAAFDVRFNRDVLGEGLYWTDAADVTRLALSVDDAVLAAAGAAGRARAQVGYDWDDVAASYEKLCHELHAARGRPLRPTSLRHALSRITHDPSLDAD